MVRPQPRATWLQRTVSEGASGGSGSPSAGTTASFASTTRRSGSPASPTAFGLSSASSTGSCDLASRYVPCLWVSRPAGPPARLAHADFW